MTPAHAFAKADRLLLPEAGGGAAHSAYLLLPEWARQKVVAVDCNPEVAPEWEKLGHPVRFLLEQDVVVHDGDAILPSDNYFRINRNIKSRITGNTPLTTHHKVACMERLEAYTEAHDTTIKVQQRVRTVCRESMSSGSRGTTFHATTKDVLVTEYIPFDEEYVVDFFSGDDLLIYPRISHRRSSGYDAMVTLVGNSHPMYKCLAQATQDVVSALNLHGVGHVQLGWHDGMWFIEAAERLSGTAWINRKSGGNPLMGIPSNEFHSMRLPVWGVLHDL